MSTTVTPRPFDAFKTAITDPEYFFGRTALLTKIIASPTAINVLIGGRRIGKTSALRALEWTLLAPTAKGALKPFPVYISLDVEQPTGLDNFRFTLIRRLRDSMERWSNSSGSNWRERYRAFLRQISGAEVAIGSLIKLKLENPEQTRRLVHEDFRHALITTIRNVRDMGFEGVLFILDEAEYIVRREWANDAWSYIRGLKDTDTAVRPSLGIVIAGYRDIAEYSQRVGSPLLNIAEVSWMPTLSRGECDLLTLHRAKTENSVIGHEELMSVYLLSGGHPFITQQVMNEYLDSDGKGIFRQPASSVLQAVGRDSLGRAFQMWWNDGDKSDGFSELERRLYRAIAVHQESSVDSLAAELQVSVSDATAGLDVLAGTGVIGIVGSGRYSVGSKLFEEWVASKLASRSA